MQISTGAKTTQSGIYVPDVDNSCAEFLSTNYNEAPSANVLLGHQDLLHPITGVKYGEQAIYEKKRCNWFLVEPITLPDPPADAPAIEAMQRERIPAGGTCPEAGFYFTPARPESRRLFQKGEVMPAFDTAYGATIWQRDNDQT
jgi:hypothetical protein